MCSPRRLSPLVFLCVMALSAAGLSGQTLFSFKVPGLNLVYYSQAHEYVIQHLARSFVNTMDYYKKFFHYTPSGKTSIFVEDFSDWGNGGATAVPQNLVFLELSPFDHAYDMMSGYERMSLIMNHELVHVVTMDKPVGSSPFFRKIFFGKVGAEKENPLSMFYTYLTSPRMYTPRWYLEGIAVFMETWMNGGLGRSLGAYDEMAFRTKVLENDVIYDALSLESEGTAVDFQIGALSYMYGARFFSFLAVKYGPQKVIDWVSVEKDSKSSFTAAFKQTFGRRLVEDWADWIKAEKVWQEENLNIIRQYPVTEFKPLTDRQMGSVSRGFYDPDRGKVYAGVNYPGQVASLAEIDVGTGRMKRLCDIKGAALYSVCALAFDKAGGRLFYSTDNNTYRDLRVYDLASGRSDKLMMDCRIGDLVFNPRDKSLWGIRHNTGLSTLVRIDPPYSDWTAVYGFDYYADVYGLDISPDGAWISAAISDVSGNQKLVRMSVSDLLRGTLTLETLHDFGTDSPSDFRYSEDGRFLYGSSYYTGASNILRYDPTGKTLDVLSNAETGFFRPIPINDRSLLVFKYTKDGFLPGFIETRVLQDVNAVRFLGQEVVKRHPEVKEWTAGSPADIPIESLIESISPYSSFKDIGLNSAYPIVEGYKDTLALGVRMEFRNALRYHGFDVSASYSPSTALPAKERLHLGLIYHYWNWRISATYNNASFYDLFGPTMSGMKGYSLGLDYSRDLIYDPPRNLTLDFGIAGYAGLDRLPDYQNIDAMYDKLVSARIGLKYNFVRRSLGAVDEEKGYRAHVFARANYVNGRLYPRLYGRLDYGLALPINHSSVWLRTAFGQSFGDRENNFVRFFFGGFGNNWIDSMTEKRYREYYSFPGLELNELGGKTFAKGTVEWTLPPVTFRRFGFMDLYCTWARLAVFTSGIVTDFDDAAFSRKLVNFGAQLDFRIVVFSLMNSTFSVGYARAYEKGLPGRNEFMISLKLM